MSEGYKRNPNTECVVCKTPIYRRPIQIEKNMGKVFCSMKCYGIHCRKEIPCLSCGKLILAGLNKKTCSRSCANIQRTGIKYKIGRPRDKAVTFRIIKLRLLKERGGYCERCNYSKYEVLQVHHKNRKRTNNKIENLEIICPNCYYEEHLLEKSWLSKKFD